MNKQISESKLASLYAGSRCPEAGMDKAKIHKDCRCEELPALEKQVEDAEHKLRLSFKARMQLRKALEEIIPMLHQIGVHPTTRLLKIKAHIDKALTEGRSE